MTTGKPLALVVSQVSLVGLKVPLSETIKKETKSTGDERKKPTCSICKLGTITHPNVSYPVIRNAAMLIFLTSTFVNCK
jgi:hypothetical protein